jgi:hypothetical protein
MSARPGRPNWRSSVRARGSVRGGRAPGRGRQAFERDRQVEVRVGELRIRLQHAPELRDGQLEIARLQHQVRQVEARLGLIGIQRQRRLERLARAVRVAGAVGEAAQVRARRRQPRDPARAPRCSRSRRARRLAARRLRARPLHEPVVRAARVVNVAFGLRGPPGGALGERTGAGAGRALRGRGLPGV